MKDILQKVKEYLTKTPVTSSLWIIIAAISTLIFACLGSFIVGGGF